MRKKMPQMLSDDDLAQRIDAELEEFEMALKGWAQRFPRLCLDIGADMKAARAISAAASMQSFLREMREHPPRRR